MRDRFYSLITVKAVDDDQRIITGTATTPTPDRVGDIVEPLGVKYKNPLPLLWQHRHDQPVGTVKFDKPTKNGIDFTASIPKIDEPGPLKDRVDTAWGEVKHKLVRAVSIGFRPLEYSYMEDGGIHFQETEVLELSLVTIPAQADATIQTVKSIDHQVLTAIGREDRDDEPSRRFGILPIVKVKGPKSMKTIAEQIADFEATRKTKADELSALQELISKEGRTKTPEEKEKFDGLMAELDAIDNELVDLRKIEKLNLSKASAIVTKTGTADERTADQRDPQRPIIYASAKSQLPKGIGFVRMVGALCQARGNRHEAAEIAKRWKDSTPEVEAILRMPSDMIEKAAVNPGTTTDSTWAEPLVQYQNLASEFIEYLRPLTIVGRINGFRRVPFKVKVPRQTAGATVNWVGEAKVKPLSSLAFDSLTLDHFKIAGIIPLSEELVRFSSPSAEQLVRDDLAAAIVQFMDREFVDPTKALATGVSPASITNGVTPVTATGTTAAAFRTDVRTLFSTFLTAGISVATGHWIMTQAQALAFSMMQNSLGQPEFPGITMQGGTLLGFPVVVSENVPATGGSPTDGGLIIFAIAGEIMLADDGGVNIDVSREASLQMETTPDSPTTGSTNLVSLWQHNLIAIKAERFVNWLKRRSTAVAFIQNTRYAE